MTNKKMARDCSMRIGMIDMKAYRIDVNMSMNVVYRKIYKYFIYYKNI